LGSLFFRLLPNRQTPSEKERRKRVRDNSTQSRTGLDCRRHWCLLSVFCPKQ